MRRRPTFGRNDRLELKIGVGGLVAGGQEGVKIARAVVSLASAGGAMKGDPIGRACEDHLVIVAVRRQAVVRVHVPTG